MKYLKLSYKRWLGWLALAVLFAVACAFLSNWQFVRRAQVVSAINQLEANYSREPLSLSQVHDIDKQKWMPVSLSGNYLPELTLLVRNRSRNGNPGFEQLVPFQTASKIVFVDRGWVPTGNNQDSPDFNPLPSKLSMRIVGHILPSEPRLNRGAPNGQIPAVSLSLAANQLELNPESVMRSFYLTLSSESPKPLRQPLLLDKPQLDEGNHLSYAVQWIIFALLAFSALVWAIRKEFEEFKISNDASYRPKEKRLTRSRIDEQDEDSLIDRSTS